MSDDVNRPYTVNETIEVSIDPTVWVVRAGGTKISIRKEGNKFRVLYSAPVTVQTGKDRQTADKRTSERSCSCDYADLKAATETAVKLAREVEKMRIATNDVERIVSGWH